MRSVNLSTLKAQLSAHLQFVRDGEEILVRDRNRPIARIVPFSAEDYTSQQNRLIAAGKLAPAKNRHAVKKALPLPAPAGKMISRKAMDQIWQEEREGR